MVAARLRTVVLRSRRLPGRRVPARVRLGSLVMLARMRAAVVRTVGVVAVVGAAARIRGVVASAVGALRRAVVRWLKARLRRRVVVLLLLVPAVASVGRWSRRLLGVVDRQRRVLPGHT